MDPTTLATVVVAVASTIVATAFGLLPERLDLMFVFGAYGAGNVVGALIASRTRHDPVELGRRWGLLLMGMSGLALALGLIGVLPS